jgi:serine phosphatase RsbU (regulator of sigma subunit)
MESETSRRGLLGMRLPGSAARDARAANDADARELQTSLLPNQAPPVDGFQIACALRSSAEVSGDYFDVFSLNADETALCIADVSGKGMAAAKLMRDLHDAVRKFAPTVASPAELCTSVNQALCQPGAQTRYVTMFYGMLGRDKRLRYESAGHCLPLLVRADGSVEFPASFSGVIGIFSHWLYQNQELQLRSGDCLLLLTDGLLQAENRKHEEFGYQRLIAAVANGNADSATGLAGEILDAVTKFCGGKLQDDASLIVVRAN